MSLSFSLSLYIYERLFFVVVIVFIRWRSHPGKTTEQGTKTAAKITKINLPSTQYSFPGGLGSQTRLIYKTMGEGGHPII